MYSLRQITKVASRGQVTRSVVKAISTRGLYLAVPRTTQPIVNRWIQKDVSSYRSYSVLSSSPEAKVYKYCDIKKIATSPTEFPETILVDVREPFEFQDGHIPSAINIPFKSSPGALALSAEEFVDNFGFEKPEATKELVFYCLGGVRSTSAEGLADTFGYKKRGNYVGSWEDWVEQENKA